ncbi:mitochondrial protein Pet127-domain-containing protein [Blastocladiella britannica]|nr:mitochondrial protein Pet127-domain-containing protein [Blastocladiella britannica]
MRAMRPRVRVSAVLNRQLMVFIAQRRRPRTGSKLAARISSTSKSHPRTRCLSPSCAMVLIASSSSATFLIYLFSQKVLICIPSPSSPGVHFLQDPRSGVYNFDPYLQRIVHPDEVNFDTFPPYITASKDTALTALATKHKCTFVSSTSSISGALSNVYFMISGGRPIDISRLSQDFTTAATNFTRMTRAPASVIITRRPGTDVFSIDADKSYASGDTILSRLGKSMERMLTATRSEFVQHLSKATPEGDVSRAAEVAKDVPPEAYAYGRSRSLLLRAQLDCVDPRLPRRTFDLKTRATLAIRMDADNYADNTGYHIQYAHGLFSSYEREYYDMLRAAFLKYSLQVRIGHMDGIMVAFHNTQRIFGFQYISLEEMDSSLFGSSAAGDQAFALSMQVLEDVLHKARGAFPGHDILRVTFDSEQGENAVYVEALPDGADPNDLYLERVDPKSKSSIKHDVTRFRVLTTSLVNGKVQLDDSHPSLSPSDTWSLKYSVAPESGRGDHVSWDYYKLRRSQAANRRTSPTEESKAAAAAAAGAVSGFDGKSAPIAPQPPRGLMRTIRKHYVNEEAVNAKTEAAEKTLYTPRFKNDVALGKGGKVLDDGLGQ